jgi:holliday junction DNA helicase RuvA
MIAYVNGTLTDKTFTTAVIDCGGVGYEVYLNSKDISNLPGIGSEVKIHTFLQIREDAHILFGFIEKSDLEIFKQLITVSGIGPKGALSILSTFSGEDLKFAVLSGDSGKIAHAPGIGKKTAEKLIIELRDKLKFNDSDDMLGNNTNDKMISASAGEDMNSQNIKDAVSALVSLGYPLADSLKAVRKVKLEDNMTTGDILKEALKKIQS